MATQKINGLEGLGSALEDKLESQKSFKTFWGQELKVGNDFLAESKKKAESLGRITEIKTNKSGIVQITLENGTLKETFQFNKEKSSFEDGQIYPIWEKQSKKAKNKDAITTIRTSFKVKKEFLDKVKAEIKEESTETGVKPNISPSEPASEPEVTPIPVETTVSQTEPASVEKEGGKNITNSAEIKTTFSVTTEKGEKIEINKGDIYSVIVKNNIKVKYAIEGTKIEADRGNKDGVVTVVVSKNLKTGAESKILLSIFLEQFKKGEIFFEKLNPKKKPQGKPEVRRGRDTLPKKVESPGPTPAEPIIVTSEPASKKEQDDEEESKAEEKKENEKESKAREGRKIEREDWLKIPVGSIVETEKVQITAEGIVPSEKLVRGKVTKIGSDCVWINEEPINYEFARLIDSNEKFTIYMIEKAKENKPAEKEETPEEQIAKMEAERIAKEKADADAKKVEENQETPKEDTSESEEEEIDAEDEAIKADLYKKEQEELDSNFESWRKDEINYDEYEKNIEKIYAKYERIYELKIREKIFKRYVEDYEKELKDLRFFEWMKKMSLREYLKEAKETLAEIRTELAELEAETTKTKTPKYPPDDILNADIISDEYEGEFFATNLKLARTNFASHKIHEKGKPNYETRLKELEEKYNYMKNNHVKNILEKGGTEEDAQQFLITELEAKRNAEYEMHTAFGKAITKEGWSRGIEAWDKMGEGTGLKNYSARLLKMTITMSIMGLLSSASVEGLAKQGFGTANALSGGITSYMGRKLGFGVGIGAIMEVVPPKYRNIARLVIMAISTGAVIYSGGAVAGLAVGASTAVGFGLSKLVQSGKLSEKSIEENLKNTITENNLNKADLEASLTKFEQEYEASLNKAQNTRLWRKVAGGAASLTGSVVSLEVFGYKTDYAQENQIENNVVAQTKDPENTQDVPDTTKYGSENLNGATEDDKTEVSNTETKAESETKTQNENTTQNNTNPTEKTPENTTTNTVSNTEITKEHISVVHKGEGVEHALRREIETNIDLAKNLGYKGDPDDKEALHKFSGRGAHILAIKEDLNNIFVKEADKISYEIKIDTDGELTVEKNALDGAKIEDLETKITQEDAVPADKIENDLEKSQVDPTTGEPMKRTEENDLANSQTSPLTEQTPAPSENKDTTEPQNKTIENPNKTEEDKKYENYKTADEVEKPIVTEEISQKMFDLHKENLMHLFPKNKAFWDEIRGIPANKFVNADPEGLVPLAKNFATYMDTLSKISGLTPKDESWLIPAETTEKFIRRAMEHAAAQGIKDGNLSSVLDKIKL